MLLLDGGGQGADAIGVVLRVEWVMNLTATVLDAFLSVLPGNM